MKLRISKAYFSRALLDHNRLQDSEEIRRLWRWEDEDDSTVHHPEVRNVLSRGTGRHSYQESTITRCYWLLIKFSGWIFYGSRDNRELCVQTIQRAATTGSLVGLLRCVWWDLGYKLNLLLRCLRWSNKHGTTLPQHTVNPKRDMAVSDGLPYREWYRETEQDPWSVLASVLF